MKMKPEFKGVSQVGLVVKDCMATMRKYVNDYGIGPWAIYDFTPEVVQDMVIRGEPVKYAMRLAIATIGTFQIELIQPLDDKSIYSEFLKSHGDGVHHLLFDVDNFDQTVGFFQEKGFGILQGGCFSGARYSYFDTTEELGFITEIHHMPPNATLPEPDDFYPKPGA